MSKISICREHSMAHEDLLNQVEELADKLVAKYGGEYEWDGDELCYRYSGGVTAKILCTDEDVNVDIKLGMLMAMLKGTISREVEEYLDNHIS